MVFSSWQQATCHTARRWSYGPAARPAKPVRARVHPSIVRRPRSISVRWGRTRQMALRLAEKRPFVDLINLVELRGWELAMCCMVRVERRCLSAGKIKNGTMQKAESRVKPSEFDSRASIVYYCRPRTENWRTSGKTIRSVRKLAFLFGFALAGVDTKVIVGRT